MATRRVPPIAVLARNRGLDLTEVPACAFPYTDRPSVTLGDGHGRQQRTSGSSSRVNT